MVLDAIIYPVGAAAPGAIPVCRPAWWEKISLYAFGSAASHIKGFKDIRYGQVQLPLHLLHAAG
jgi:hypothetical protein